jgi:transcriptional regulator with XRE-family HTH domain
MNELLRERRKQAMWTQEDLARRLGVAELSVRRWEAGQSIPQPNQLRNLCQLFNASPADLGFPITAPPLAYGRPSVTAPDLPWRRDLDDDQAPAVRRSQEGWHEVRRYLAEHGADLVAPARHLYEQLHFIGASDAFAHPDWVMPEPIDVQHLDLAWMPAAPPPSVAGTEPEARLCLPLHSPGHQYDRYSTAVRHLDRPRLFENRISYRLYSYDRAITDDVPTMRFSLGTYFDKVDVSETLVHEYAVASLDRQRRGRSLAPTLDELPFRALVGDPFGLVRRPVLPGVVTLTLRRSPSGADPSMLLHLRDPAQVAIGGRVHTLIPSGEFQPASIAPASLEADLSLWRNTA